MTPFYKKYIAALIHNPNVLNEHIFSRINAKDDIIAPEALMLLYWSYFLSKNTAFSSVWSASYRTDNKLYPPFHNLYACITDKEIDDFDKEEIMEEFGDEVKYLQLIYKTVEPDKKTMTEKPRLIDLFGFVHDVEEISTVFYFNQIGPFGANIKCQKCKVVTHYKGYNKMQFKVEPTDIIKYQYQHQCQKCGSLKMADINNTEDSLEILCECAGQFRRDKPLFCYNCIAMSNGIENF
ncbi:MAG: hypothetical protein ACR2KX_09380 [Chitinophagaceae bacterium]